MKKQFVLLTILGALFLGAFSVAAQDSTAAAAPAQEQATTTDDTAAAEEGGFHQLLKDWFIDGGTAFMWPILITFIIGLAISIERIITLNLARINTKKLLARIEDALNKGGVEAAKNVT